MTKRSRTILFFVFFFLFITIAPTAVLYSQGYRIDFEGKKLIQTGGIHLTFQPKQVDIYLDGKLKKRTGIFFNSLLIENLLPKNYIVEIRKENYNTWKGVFRVEEKMVSETNNIILFPKEISITPITSNVKNFWFSPDQKKMILKEETNENWSLKLYELEKNLKTHLINERDISSKGVELISLEFSEDSNKIILEVGTKEQLKYFQVEINKTPAYPVETVPPSPPVKNPLAYQQINEDVYYLNNNGDIFKTNISSGENIKLTKKPFPVKLETAHKLKVAGEYIFLTESEILYQFNIATKEFKEIFHEIKDLKISPNSEKLIYYSGYEIWLYYLKEKKGQFTKQAGERSFLLRLSEEPKNIFWLNSDYLVYSIGDEIKTIGIGETVETNIVKIVEIKNPEIFWNETNNSLYVLSEGNLYQSERLIK